MTGVISLRVLLLPKGIWLLLSSAESMILFIGGCSLAGVPLRILEPYEGKLSSTVLLGGKGGKSLLLYPIHDVMEIKWVMKL